MNGTVWRMFREIRVWNSWINTNWNNSMLRKLSVKENLPNESLGRGKLSKVKRLDRKLYSYPTVNMEINALYVGDWVNKLLWRRTVEKESSKISYRNSWWQFLSIRLWLDIGMIEPPINWIPTSRSSMTQERFSKSNSGLYLKWVRWFHREVSSPKKKKKSIQRP